ncbi:MAG: hypothetical protein P4L50_12810 [Anaerolineaceae bacterium]|nr:hypothetical protein [Anaerolineaceae bacterium]
MTLPAFIFGILVATLLGSAFHLWRGGGLGRLILYIIFSWIGFWAGHGIGDQIGITFWTIGPLRLGMAIIGSLIALGIGYWLSLVRIPKT